MGEMAKVLVLKRRPDGGHVGSGLSSRAKRSVPTRTREATITSSIRCTGAPLTRVTLTASTSRTKATPGRRSTCYTPLGGIRALGADARTSRRCGTEST
jgi:hypothetical protein